MPLWVRSAVDPAPVGASALLGTNCCLSGVAFVVAAGAFPAAADAGGALGADPVAADVGGVLAADPGAVVVG